MAAAWLHDIGYAEELLDTGFHPLDGARFLASAGARLETLNTDDVRALTEAETRQRIVEATVELHQTLGPAKTTIKAIAERADRALARAAA